MFTPSVLNPDPEPWFIKELHIIDKDLRVVWGYERYLENRWVIERKIPRDRYHAMYRAILESGMPRFIPRPIFDNDQPIYSYLEDGTEAITGYQQIGFQEFDLAPEWEWIETVRHPDGSYKPLSSETILGLKRQYAWNRNHAFSRARYEEAERLKDEKREAEQKQKRKEMFMESYDEALLEAGHRVTTGA